MAFPTRVPLTVCLIVATAAAALPVTPDASGAGAAPGGNAPAAFGATLTDLLAACADDGCRMDAAHRAAVDAGERWSALPTGRAGVAASIRLALDQSGIDAARVDAAPSASLRDALLGLHAAYGVEVDAGAVSAQVMALDAAAAEPLRGLVDAVADAQRTADGILAPAARAVLDGDLRETLLLATFRAESADTARRWDERAEALAGADRGALGAAALRVGDALGALPPLVVAASSCARLLDLPLVVVGGPCDDTYTASVALLVDVGGDDTYLNAAGASPFAGAGVGVALDQGTGNDTYATAGRAQGFALGGVGVLVDEGGHDAYSVAQFGQGFGVAGLGLLYDAGTGNDRYDSPTVLNVTIGTKAGGLGGVGILVDEGGDDAYRQDGLDGFVYGAADGHGFMHERGGDDDYVSRAMPTWLLGSFLGSFAGPIQVSAEVGTATAILVDESGDDRYECGDHVRQGCQGAGGAGAVGLLLDRAGDDVYTMGVSFSVELVPGVAVFPMGQGAGYGPSAPGGVGLLVDEAGADVYVAEKWAQGFGTVGLGFLSDGGGADSYSVTSARLGSRGDGSTWADGAAGAGRDA